MEDRVKELEQMLKELLSVPRRFDEATIPSCGMDENNRLHRKQVVCNLSVSYDRIYRATKLLEKKCDG